ncbi:hypothetical protein SERLADRAFT_460253 [Serpula lacrymans var. lacrymans S7.9]|uniref:Uncharacterized protein n=1 Tax=Serpula lacrymans var. lacrymans (strain S7.9) TaxID=578457 RepID=F8NPR5_SERL9|nr:uncharacterized protein SERLADRAFT_460253 [Serpula lacrymans var. lacrymans S7.9]EGO27221.1 hypothetical protein SERLADRAFT_460253 [Serpula lacrymans var. lacrymans S7.9]
MRPPNSLGRVVPANGYRSFHPKPGIEKDIPFHCISHGRFFAIVIAITCPARNTNDVLV